MPNLIDLTRQKFNRLTVLSRAENRKKEVFWLCICDCGVKKEIPGGSLRSGQSRSCGCYMREVSSENGKRVGNLPKIGTHNKSKTPEHNTWFNIKSRCSLKRKLPMYENYWGRGISVCERWLESFENFYSDMGPRPSKYHSIDRIDNNGNYSKENCRWATDKQQARNKRTNLFITYKGATRLITEWSFLIKGGKQNTLRGRLNAGWSLEEAIETPVKHINKDKNVIA
jgi:hypothetical protein